ncbi:hypothetical protein MANES_01G034400v8 [Manihot esculenta]|uniref:Uncharacterized protein n=1 Tax=Manihot esculenta TaxID=3983 RepID=A0ACB7IA13_MANES|nr:hypothetical protein MANES_01G034400v8 [Manihot esculenta]
MSSIFLGFSFLNRIKSLQGPSGHPESGRSTPTFSDSSEDEPTFKSCLSSRCNFSGRHSFLSKPIHPLFFPVQAPKEASETQASRLSEFDAATVQRDAHHWSSASSSADSSDISEPLESEIVGRLCISSNVFKCGLCERFLSQRSPWSSRRIVRSGDMPVAGVLSCCHVFHAECLEQTTPKAHKNDPPCPLCVGLEDENSAVLQVFPGLRDRFPNSKTSSEYGPSGPWGCVTMGDFVGGTLHSPHRNTTLLLNRNRMRKNLSLKGNSSKEFPGKLRKNGSYSSQLLNGNAVDFGTVGCSKMTTNPSMKRLH